MQIHIDITEEDIYRFVFSPELLSKDKYDYLTINRERFKDEIALCLEMKNDTNSDEIKILTDSILRKINPTRIITLFPQITRPTEGIGVKLAAASVLKEKKSNSMSFADSDSKYLIRIVKTESQILLYLFTSENSKKHFKLTFYPSESEYQIKDLSRPIEILEEDVIEKIIIE